jgi:hypothetical protein
MIRCATSTKSLLPSRCTCFPGNAGVVLLFLTWCIGAKVDDVSVLHLGEATFYGEGSFGHCGFPVEDQPQLGNGRRSQGKVRESEAPITVVLMRNTAVLQTNLQSIAADVFTINGKKAGFFLRASGLL